MKLAKLIIGILVSLAAAQLVFGQNTEGVINYEVKIDIHRTLPPERAEMKNTIPNFQTTQQQLFFNAAASLYKVAEADDDAEFESENGGMRIRLQQPQVEVYTDLSDSKSVTQQEFNGKNYLMEDSLTVVPWKFGTALKTIIGYECKQASHYNEARKQNVVAWYTTKLRPSLGPEQFFTLPGAVLEVDINEGERTITAQSFTKRKLKKGELKRPTQGVRMKREAFRKMVDEQMERMRANGGNMIIRN